MLKPIEQDIEVESSVGEGDGQQEREGLTQPPEVDHEAEYVDEDRYTTVTVEAMDLSKKYAALQKELQELEVSMGNI